MTIKKTLTSIVLAGALILGTLTGCDSKKDSANDPLEETKPKKSRKQKEDF